MPSVELVRRLQAGEQDALEELCLRYLPRIRTIVRQRLGPQIRRKVDSVEVVHDALLQGFKQNLKSFEFRDEGALLRYLCRIAENEIRDRAEYWARQKRDAKREVKLPSKASLLGLADEREGTPSRIVTLAEDLALLESAMDHLREESSDYWELIVAIDLEGQTDAEVASVSGQTRDAVRMRRKRAKLRLAQIYARLHGNE